MKNASVSKSELKRILPLAELPGLPQSAVRFLELSKDPNNGPIECAVPVEIDPGLTGQVLRHVNSSYYGFAQKISNVKMALVLVGVRIISKFVIFSAVLRIMPNWRCGPYNLKTLWQDSLRRALFARAFANLLGIKDAEDVFTAALLQDMAIPILARELPSSYVKLLTARNNGQIRLSALESQEFGWTHAEAAGMIARHWKFPPYLIDLIEGHVSIELFAKQHTPDKLSIAMSALLPTVADPDWTEFQEFTTYYEKLVSGNHPTIVELLDRIDHEYDLLAPVLKLPKPAKSLMDCYNEATVSTT
jgi:HD-like signal output (HDOD) protein